jgi:hypothetical protein
MGFGALNPSYEVYVARAVSTFCESRGFPSSHE